ncbi:MAG: tRNA (cytidine(34)-2'-O)-methyltransferase [Blastochloris sp.]|nr:tRNA (cytidine(34)-2'-O)-methyltransferase [Blastochloris sp.]
MVLVEPEIPPNTGNIARLCAATRSRLHLVGPLGFSLDEKHLKRAGLDYWHLLDYQTHDSWSHFVPLLTRQRFFLLSSKATQSCYQTSFQDGDFLIFGRESKGLPASLLAQYPEQSLTIPMLNPEARCLNLSSSVAIVLYEALRQTRFTS